MLSVQQIADIAAGYFTTMADAMIWACVQWAVNHGEPLDIPERRQAKGVTRTDREPHEYAGVDWERMVRGNSDIIGPRAAHRCSG